MHMCSCADALREYGRCKDHSARGAVTLTLTLILTLSLTLTLTLTLTDALREDGGRAHHTARGAVRTAAGELLNQGLGHTGMP